MRDVRYEIRPIGWVESPLVDRDAAPKQGDEGSPEAWLVFDPALRTGIGDLVVGAEIIVLTWLDRSRRDVLVVHPCDRGHSGARQRSRGFGRNTHRGRQARTRATGSAVR
jgi:tRNA (Thr-GGU) A37 N-methylase